MCGCDCCQNNDPTCFDPALIDTASPFRTWVCGCTCPNCISNVIRGAKDAGYKIGYGAALDADRDLHDEGVVTSVQRYNTMSKRSEGGLFVLYADHVAAVAEAEQRGREVAYNEIPAIAVYGERLRSEGYDIGHAAGMRMALADFLTSIDDDDPVYRRGRADALAAAREAVAGLLDSWHWGGGFYPRTAILAAIEALKGEQK